jgi:2-(1,2-epoxy-1,2-dihydrophenyl)acetyl-CoA isomerase
MSDTALLYDVDGESGIATLTLNRPQQKNAMDMSMRVALREAVYAIRRDRSIRAVVLCGAGQDFCSGGDVHDMKVGSAEAGRNRIDDLHGWVSMLIDLDRPVIALLTVRDSVSHWQRISCWPRHVRDSACRS